MNIFVIPSWYPSKDYPINGIMIKEQFEIICKIHPTINIGISLWGQKDENYLLHTKDHIKNLKKIFFAPKHPSKSKIFSNLQEYTSPAFTWNHKILKGNLTGIVKANLINLRAFEREYGPAQLIHIQTGHPAGLIGMKVSQETGVPYIITERMGPFPSIYASDKNGQLLPAYQKVYNLSAANVAVSPFQESIMQGYGIQQLYTIPDFIDENLFEPSLIQTRKSFTFFTLARIEASKGLQELIEAMHLITKQNKEISLRIGGIGSQLDTYKKMAKEMHLEKTVTWLGDLSREDILAEFQQSHAFVLPSHYESFGISYIEALACGKPVVASKCGGPETIVNSENGLLVEKKDTAGLAEAMLKMVKSYTRYNSSQIRKDFINKFSSKVIVPQIISFYKEIINKHTSKP